MHGAPAVLVEVKGSKGVEAAVVLQPPRGLQRFLDRDTAAYTVGHIQLGGDRNRRRPVFLHFASHRQRDTAGHLGPVLQRSAE